MLMIILKYEHSILILNSLQFLSFRKKANERHFYFLRSEQKIKIKIKELGIKAKENCFYS